MSQIAYTLLQNYLDGHPVKDDEGHAPWLVTQAFPVTAETATEFIKYCHDGNLIPISEYNVKRLTYRYNENVTYHDYVDLISDYSVPAIVQAHGETWS
jgi:hypothetical protein